MPEQTYLAEFKVLQVMCKECECVDDRCVSVLR